MRSASAAAIACLNSSVTGSLLTGADQVSSASGVALTAPNIVPVFAGSVGRAWSARGRRNPGLTTQDFTIALIDQDGHEGTVSAAGPRYGTALHQTTGSTTARVHIVLNQIRVPLADFAAQGVDLANLRRIEFRFGGDGKPATGSIELADVRFQESVAGPTVYTDRLADVAPTTTEPSATTRAAEAIAPAAPDKAAAATTTAAAPGCTVHATLTSAKVKSCRLTLTSTANCATAVRVVIARVGSARAGIVVRAKLAQATWTATTTLARGAIA